jgi:release factor glutamine methyltransferase
VTLQEAVAHGRAQLREAGINDAEAELDARLLAQLALGWDAVQFLTRAGESATSVFVSAYEPLVGRRARREPFAYIAGEKEFWNLTFRVSPAVLIPRPETELIVEAALARHGGGIPLSIADVCTGSGCLAIAIAHERPLASVVATDISAKALDVARFNASRLHVDSRVVFVETDLLVGVEGIFDLIVSNPPYVPEYERSTLEPEVRDYEPPLALVAGSGGLAVIRSLVDQSLPRLKPGGSLLFEFGFGQAEAVRVMLSSTKGFGDINLIRDLQGIPRTAVARRIV